ncbi:MAG TPA: vanadium-dependent haloperoxidase, partial [Chitinophagaceae bacterium]
PAGDGLWVPTAPAFANPVSPYWGNNRPVITGSIVNTQPGAPIAYSTDPASGFYKMVKQVYDASQNLTDAQKAMAIFWRDVPGVSSPGHWLSIVQQVIRQTNSSLDKAALAYALTGAAINDALISCWKTKYQYSLIRPITYIRNVMGYTDWLPYLTTPAHPEYSSAHAVLSAAAADVMQNIFGNTGSFTDHTYDYLGFAPRTYSSFVAIGEEAGQSRLYAGIHYQPSIDAGLLQGKKVAANILHHNNRNTGNSQ